MNLSDLKKNPKNPRTITKEMLEKLKNSIKNFERMLVIRPMIIDENNVILGGNQRFNALEALGYEEIPDTWVKKEEGLTEEQKREFVVKDNVGFGAWDFEQLANDYSIEELEDWGMENIVFPEIVEDGKTDPNEVPEPPKIAKTVRGDLYELGGHRVLCGDSTIVADVEKLMGGKKAKMLHTDPPYGVDCEGIENDNMKGEKLREFITNALSNAFVFLEGGSNVYIWHADIHSYEFIGAMRDSGFVQAKPPVIQWVKDRLVLSRGDYHSRNEPCLYGWKKGKNRKRVEDRTQDTIWEFPKPEKSDSHPTMKPVELCERAITNSSEKGWIVLDLFLGAGSTTIACQKTKRKCYGMEIDEKYCDVIVQRWLNFTEETEFKLNGKKITKAKWESSK